MRYPAGKDYKDYLNNWYIAQGFGAKTSYGLHEGIDLNLKTGGDTDLGQPLYCIADGEVTSAHEHATGFGKHLHISHKGEWGTVFSHYAHCQEIKVKVGDLVKEGQVIATLGKSGTEAAHLHFAIKKQPTGVDAVVKDATALLMWENPTEFLNTWGGNMTNELQECLRMHGELVNEATDLKKTIETMKSEKQAILTDIENMKTAHAEEIKLLKVQLDGLINLETQLQQERDGRREDNLAWEIKRTEWEGEMEKIKQQMASEDLSLRDYKVLINALMKKILKDIEGLKK